MKLVDAQKTHDSSGFATFLLALELNLRDTLFNLVWETPEDQLWQVVIWSFLTKSLNDAHWSFFNPSLNDVR